MNKYIKLLFIVAAFGFVGYQFTGTVEAKQDAYVEAFSDLEMALNDITGEG